MVEPATFDKTTRFTSRRGRENVGLVAEEINSPVSEE